MKKIIFLITVLSLIATGCDFSSEALIGKRSQSDGIVSSWCGEDTLSLDSTTIAADGSSVPTLQTLEQPGMDSTGKYYFQVRKLSDGKFPEVSLNVSQIDVGAHNVSLTYECVVAQEPNEDLQTKNVTCAPRGNVRLRDFEGASSDMRFRVTSIQLKNGYSEATLRSRNSWRWNNSSSDYETCTQEFRRQSGVRLGDMVIRDVYLEWNS